MARLGTSVTEGAGMHYAFRVCPADHHRLTGAAFCSTCGAKLASADESPNETPNRSAQQPASELGNASRRRLAAPGAANALMHSESIHARHDPSPAVARRRPRHILPLLAGLLAVLSVAFLISVLFTSNDSPAAGTPGFDAAPSQPEVKGQIVGQLDYESRSLEFNLDLLAGGERASRHIGEACGFKQPYTGLLGSQIRLLDSQNAVIGLGSVADEAVLVQDNTAGLMDLPLACSLTSQSRPSKNRRVKSSRSTWDPTASIPFGDRSWPRPSSSSSASTNSLLVLLPLEELPSHRPPWVWVGGRCPSNRPRGTYSHGRHHTRRSLGPQPAEGRGSARDAHVSHRPATRVGTFIQSR